MKLALRTFLLSFVIGLAFLDASGSNNEEDSCTIKFSKSTSNTSQTSTIASSLASTSKPTIFTQPLPYHDVWESMREKGHVYVDKTSFLEYLLDRHTTLHLFTRPRGFGKSLFVSMMNSFFLGNQSLFKGTQIYDRGNVHDESNGRWIEYPVIDLDFSMLTFGVTDTYTQKVNKFKNKLLNEIKFIAELHGIDRAGPEFSLTVLIQQLKMKFNLPVIILVDEYDFPINKALYAPYSKMDRKLADELAKALNIFFLEIKKNIDYLRFVWVTGVTKLGPTVLGNRFVDVTNEKEFAAAMGFTKEEIKSNFKSHIEVISAVRGREEKKIVDLLIKMFDGYRFSLYSEIRVFEPFSVIKYLRNERFDNHWKTTSSLDYIIPRFWKENHTISEFKNFKRKREFFFPKRNMIRKEIPLAVHMLLIGYLTIQSYDNTTDTCVLTYANTQTEEAICNGMRNYMPSETKKFVELKWLTTNLRTVMQNADISKFVEILNQIGFPEYHTPSNDTVNEKEVTRRLIAILETFETLFGMSTEAEGDIDITTLNLAVNYVIDVKCGMAKNATSALDGIKQQIEYVTKTEKKRISFIKALRDRDQLYLLAIHFNKSYGEKIDEWIFLPFEGNKLRFDKMKASSRKLLDEVKNMKSEMNIDPNFIVD